MIDISLTDKNNKSISGCGISLFIEKEIKTYKALREALLNRSKLIEIFGEN